MNRHRTLSLVEGILTGTAWACGLVVMGVLAIGSFRPGELPRPYWGHVPWLRSDTFGMVCLVIGTLALAGSEYLRLARASGRLIYPRRTISASSLILLALGRAVAVGASAVVTYLSLNVITHPSTLTLHATHFLSWPTEGTLRVAALCVVVIAVGCARVAHSVID